MRKLPVLLFGVSVLLVAIRLFTGITYLRDDETVFYVIKRAPSLAIERWETPEHPVEQDIILEGEEWEPPLGEEYIALMEWVPGISGVLLLASIVLFCAAARWGRKAPIRSIMVNSALRPLPLASARRWTDG